MQEENALKLLIAGASLTGGAFLTAVRSKLTGSKQQNWLHWIFHIVSLLVIAGAVSYIIFFPQKIKDADWLIITVLVLAIVFSIGLSWATQKLLVGKFQYTTTQLDPVVNKFSTDADTENIKLIAGNLDFFETKGNMDAHPQYAHLRSLNFQTIHILCRGPLNPKDKRRYGKILTDFPGAELKFYNPAFADVKLRGRIKTLNGVTRLLMYNKISGEKYEALEHNTAEENGALYTRLWNLLWETAEIPTPQELADYKNAYHF